jgi:hypothetical protein
MKDMELMQQRGIAVDDIGRSGQMVDTGAIA